MDVVREGVYAHFQYVGLNAIAAAATGMGQPKGVLGE